MVCGKGKSRVRGRHVVGKPVQALVGTNRWIGRSVPVFADLSSRRSSFYNNSVGAGSGVRGRTKPRTTEELSRWHVACSAA